MSPKEINYSAAYSFADNTISAIRDPLGMGFTDDVLSDFFDFRTPEFFDQIEKPQKRTLLHSFIYNINGFGIQHYLGKIDGDIIISDYSSILEGANIPKPSWFNSNEVEGHLNELSILLDHATMLITDAAFQLLFADRTFLFDFNKKIALYVSTLQPQEHPCVVGTGKIKRVYFPVWLKNAVFHRDKGQCQLCGCDLTNIMVPTENRHIDHMVPLNASGTNDPTNFQLTCESCNTSKGSQVLATNHLSYPYW